MFAENGKISIRQMQALLLLDCFGTALLFLPAHLAQLAGNACWLAALFCGIAFALLSLLLTTALSRIGGRFPGGGLAEWCRGGLGGFFGTLFLLGLGIKMLLDGAAELRVLGALLSRLMLPATPLWLLLLLLLLASGALAAQGLEGCGRAAEILMLFVGVPLLLVWIAVVFSAEYARILPLALPSAVGFWQSLPAMSIVFQGLVFLYFLPPDLKKPQKMRRAVLHSVLLSAGIAAGAVFFSLAAYGAEILSEKSIPTLQMLERVRISGIFLARQDLLLLWFWFAAGAIFLSGTIFFGASLGMGLFRQGERRRRPWRIGWMLALFAAALLPEEILRFWREQAAPWSNAVYLLLLPLLLLAAGKGGKANA